MVDRLLGRTHEAAPPAPAPTDPTAIAWAHVERARHQKRPHTLELLKAMADEFIELHGDRLFGDDEAVVAGFARIGGRRLAVVGFQKGQDTEENIRRNFGLPMAEGYRKSMRVMSMAERFGLPVLTFVDVQGAFPGAASEERGVAEAIAQSIGLMTRLRTPIVVVVTGEGGSGGALGIATGDVVLALENSYYSVITPEGCAAILWRSKEQAAQAATALKITAQEQRDLGVIDVVIAEPGEGAHTDPAETARRIRDAVMPQFDRLSRLTADELVEARYRRYRAFGAFNVAAPPAPPAEKPGLTDRLRGRLPGMPALSIPGLRREEQGRDPGETRREVPVDDSMPGREEV